MKSKPVRDIRRRSQQETEAQTKLSGGTMQTELTSIERMRMEITDDATAHDIQEQRWIESRRLDVFIEHSLGFDFALMVAMSDEQEGRVS